MVVDIIKYIKNEPRFNKLVGSDFMFVEYKCPIDIEEFQLLTDSHLITYVLSGRKDWITPNHTYALEGGDAAFIRKGVHVTKQYFEVPYCVVIFFINDDFIKRFMLENNDLISNGSNEPGDDLLYRINTNDNFTTLVTSIFHYLKKGNEIPGKLVELKFRELLFNICLNLQNAQLVGLFRNIQKASKSDIEFVMNKNFKFDLKLEDFARLCGRSLSSFKRDFKEQFQRTPAKWLTEKRLDYAKSLLLRTDLGVNEICYESGFKNTSHFSTAFKNRFNTTPKSLKSAQ